jgi:hypothetical protein
MTDKTNKCIKRQGGFKEDIDPLTNKRPIHCIAAQKTKFKKENVSQISAIVPVPEQEDIITLRYENSEEFTELAEEFEDDNDIELLIRKDGNEILVDIPVENSADFIDFLAENDIKEKEAQEEKEENDSSKVNDAKAAEKVDDIEKKDVPVDSSEVKCSVDKIIVDAQRRRSKRAVTIDKLRTAKRVGDKDNAGDLISWLKNPGKTDLKNVDSPDAE